MTPDDTPRGSREQFGRTFRIVMDRLRGNAYGQAAYAWISTRYCYPESSEGPPTQQDIADHLGIGLRTAQRAISDVRDAGGIRVVWQYENNRRSGCRYELVTEFDAEEEARPLTASPGGKTNRLPRRLVATITASPGGKTPPNRLPRRSLTASPGGSYKEIRSVQTDQYDLASSYKDPQREQQASSIGSTQEQSRQKRATAPDVASAEGGWFPFPDHAEMEAYLATAPIGGKFASPPLIRKFGYSVFDSHPDATFDTHVAMVLDAAHGQGLATSEDVCRHAMADVYLERAPRDRAWDRGADRDRRRARR